MRTLQDHLRVNDGTDGHVPWQTLRSALSISQYGDGRNQPIIGKDGRYGEHGFICKQSSSFAHIDDLAASNANNQVNV